MKLTELTNNLDDMIEDELARRAIHPKHISVMIVAVKKELQKRKISQATKDDVADIMFDIDIAGEP